MGLTDFSDVRLIVAGDVCDDVLIAGSLTRFSREALGVPVLDVTHRSVVQGGAAAAFRQVEALGADAALVPTGRHAEKTRLIAAGDVEQRHLARFDGPWPPYDALNFTALMRAQTLKADGVLYCQYRHEAPPRPILESLRGFGLRVGDVRDPAAFVGVLDVVKVAQEHAAERATGSPAQMARLFLDRFGYRAVVVTCGREGYVCASGEVDIAERGIDGAVRTTGAGDVFTATLAVALASRAELRDALSLANRAAGLACRSHEHLSTVTACELELANSQGTGWDE